MEQPPLLLTELQAPKAKTPILTLASWALMACMALALLCPLTSGLSVESMSSYVGALEVTAEPIPALTESEPLDGVSLTIWFLDGAYYFSEDTIFAESLMRGRTAEGARAYFIAWDEAGFTEYLNYWFAETVLTALPELSNARIEMRQGALILYVDVQLLEATHRVGMLYELDEAETRLNFVGIDVSDQLVSSAPDSFLDRYGRLLESWSNDALTDLTVIDPDGDLTIQRIYLAENRAEVLLAEE